MQLTFLGGTGTVTGSKYLIENHGRRVLVDAGLFQGLKQLRLRNWEAFPVEPSSIDAVVLTHAHLDHSGYVPRLVARGFKGPVYCTAATRELCGVMLPDSARLLEEEAEYANRHGFSKHHPALPLYREDDAQRALSHFEPVRFGEAFAPCDGMSVVLRRAGHLLGAASARVEWGGRSVLFSGDLGRSSDALMRPPEPPAGADTVLIESTYGDRDHSIGPDPAQALAAVVRKTSRRGGVVLIPSFAVGRAQAVLLALHGLKQRGEIPDLPVFLNSPMAAQATQIYARHAQEHRMSPAAYEAMCRGVHIVESVEESKRLNGLHMPAIIISASGMATGGRVLHHLKAFAPDPRNSIVFAGYQAAGTRGASMVAGARTVKIHGQHVPILAEVEQVSSFSGHADRRELLAWIGALPRPPAQVFVTHGEPVAADALRQAIEERHRWSCQVPEFGERVNV